MLKLLKAMATTIGVFLLSVTIFGTIQGAQAGAMVYNLTSSRSISSDGYIHLYTGETVDFTLNIGSYGWGGTSWPGNTAQDPLHCSFRENNTNFIVMTCTAKYKGYATVSAQDATSQYSQEFSNSFNVKIADRYQKPTEYKILRSETHAQDSQGNITLNTGETTRIRLDKSQVNGWYYSSWEGNFITLYDGASFCNFVADYGTYELYDCTATYSGTRTITVRNANNPNGQYSNTLYINVINRYPSQFEILRTNEPVGNNNTVTVHEGEKVVFTLNKSSVSSWSWSSWPGNTDRYGTLHCEIEAVSVEKEIARCTAVSTGSAVVIAHNANDYNYQFSNAFNVTVKSRVSSRPCVKPPSYSIPSTCIDKYVAGDWINNYSYQCFTGYEKISNTCAKSQKSRAVKTYQDDGYVPCIKAPAFSTPGTCYDRIRRGRRVRNTTFTCQPGYSKSRKRCRRIFEQAPEENLSNSCYLVGNHLNDQWYTIQIVDVATGNSSSRCSANGWAWTDPLLGGTFQPQPQVRDEGNVIYMERVFGVSRTISGIEAIGKNGVGSTLPQDFTIDARK